MDGGEFSFESISKQEAMERKQPRLTKLDATFWSSLQSYLAALTDGLRKEQERNPSSRKIALLQDELRNASRKSEALWEAREKKITLFALKNARQELAPPPENLAKEEKDLYEELCRSFRQHQPKILQTIGTEASTAPPALPATSPPRATPSQAPPRTLPPAPQPPAAAGPGAAAPAASPGTPNDLVTVRALVDVPPFVGLDGKTYRLRKGDVLTLPRKFGDMLKQRGHVAIMA